MYLTTENKLLSMILLFNAKYDKYKIHTVVYDENKSECFV